MSRSCQLLVNASLVVWGSLRVTSAPREKGAEPGPSGDRNRRPGDMRKWMGIAGEHRRSRGAARAESRYGRRGLLRVQQGHRRGQAAEHLRAAAALSETAAFHRAQPDALRELAPGHPLERVDGQGRV